MAKQKSSRSTRKSDSNYKAAAALPFDESALLALTENIEQNFTESKLSKGKREKKSILGHENPHSKKARTLPSSSGSNAVSRKRDSQGNVKSLANDRDTTAPDASSRTNPNEALLHEILSLGGTQEDLDLIDNVDSEAEDVREAGYADEGQKDVHLSKDISRFIAELGLEKQGAADNGFSDAEDDASSSSHDYEEGNKNKSPVVDQYLIAGAQSVEQHSRLSEVNAISASLAAAPGARKMNVEMGKDTNRLVFEARPDWHAAALPELPEPDILDVVGHRETITDLKKYAQQLLERDSNLYASKHMSSTSSHRFLSTIMASGTLSDKVSALTLVVQESPVHTTKSFESLLALAKKRSRGQAVTALGAMKDLLGVGVVLPSDRRLRSFASQPGLLGSLQNELAVTWRSGNELPGGITEAHLIAWAYEDWLKDIYFEILKVLEGWCGDEIEYARGRAVTYVYELLKEKPEQESNLLRLLVNKLGDPDKKLASRTSYLVLQLQTTHPLMKPVIIRAIETELLLRPGQTFHARYYAINTLNQTILSGKEEAVAQNLLSIYFDLFVTLLTKPDAQKLPVVGPAMNKKGQVQGGGGQKGKKALEKETREEAAKQASEETTEKMISAVLTGVNRALPFAKSDDQTLEKHMDMLFRITHSSNFNTSIQALMLIQQLAASKNLSVERFYRTLYESLLDPRLTSSSKHALYLNLLFRALKADLNIKRVKAFAKRMLQVVTLHQPPFICGVLYLLRELEITFPGLSVMLTGAEENEEIDEEVFRDVPDDLAEQGITADHQMPHAKQENKAATYDGRKRDPEHSMAERSCIWEVLPFVLHFHPSVSMFASRLLEGDEMPAKPDLASHTLAAFLDKFVYRNAKSSTGGLRGSSIMQPLAGGESRGVLVSNRATQGQGPVNTESFWRKKVEDVAVDDVFFHHYFSTVGKSKTPKKSKSKAGKSKDDDGSVEDDEDEIWQALVESRPEVEGPSDDESDLEMLDLDDSEDDGSDQDLEGGVIFNDEETLSDEEGSEEGSLLEGEDSDLVSLDEDGTEEEELFKSELQTTSASEEKPETSRSKKRRLKGLPTFASADDYENMLQSDDGEDV